MWEIAQEKKKGQMNSMVINQTETLKAGGGRHREWEQVGPGSPRDEGG